MMVTSPDFSLLTQTTYELEFFSAPEPNWMKLENNKNSPTARLSNCFMNQTWKLFKTVASRKTRIFHTAEG